LECLHFVHTARLVRQVRRALRRSKQARKYLMLKGTKPLWLF